MRYIDVIWKHNSPDYPIRLVSEIGPKGFETRKLEFFASEIVGYADSTSSVNGTMLGTVPVASIEEINANEEFEGKDLTKEQFLELWVRNGG